MSDRKLIIIHGWSDESKSFEPLSKWLRRIVQREVAEWTLNTEIFFSLKEAREKLEKYRLDYNTERPHSALGYRPPAEFAQRARENQQNIRIIGLLPSQS